MDPDDLISGTKMSQDSDTLIELQDLGLVMKLLTELEREVLKVEYTLPTLPIDGVVDGKNKCYAVFLLCGEKVNGGTYLRVAREASGKVRKELERRRWIPIGKTFKKQNPDSLMRYARKSSRGSRRSRVMLGRRGKNS
jgi:hypothetical protein